MTQRIFDIENEKDMQDLWDILPDDALKICKDVMGCQVWENRKEIGYTLEMIKINWHDKTEITRPVDHEDMIGCVVYFYNEPEYKSLGILKEEIDGRTFIDELGGYWDYIEPVKKSELKFWGE